MKGNKLAVLLASCLLLATVFPSACHTPSSSDNDTSSTYHPPSSSGNDAPTKFYPSEFSIVEQKGTVDLHTEKQAEYLAGDCFFAPDGANGTKEQSRPVGVRLQWRNGNGERSVSGYRLELAMEPNFEQPAVYHLTPSQTECRITNLLVEQDYYWRVTAELDEVDLISRSSSFTTGGAPRNLEVGGVTNVRDLGGWERADGTMVKQGMIYRTGRLNKSFEDSVKVEIDDTGIATMRNTMGIRSEIDLRGRKDETGGLNGVSVLGEDINYYFVKMDASSTLDNRPDEIRQVFEILAKKENYPLFFHCHIGTDRTGLIAFLVNALMGVSEEDLYRDYMFSNFGDIGSNRSHSALSKALNEVYYYPGETLAEKTEYFLMRYCGVKVDDIAAVRSILSCSDFPAADYSPAHPRNDLKVTVEKTTLNDTPIELNNIPNVVAWRRYVQDHVTEMSGTTTYIPTATDGILSLHAYTDEFGYRNTTGYRDFLLPINGETGAYAVEKTENSSITQLNITDKTDKIILYAGALNCITTIRLYDEDDITLATLAFASSGSTRKNIYKIEFTVDAWASQPVFLSISHSTSDLRTYVAAIALTDKA